jgi:outer membrane protein OmpA-like peptidoglycan-associated protein
MWAFQAGGGQMRSSALFLCMMTALAGLSALACGPATAQPAGDVIVNPQAAAGRVLLYPGGDYMRVVPHLLQPGQKTGPIHLHMPSKRRPVRVATAPAAPKAKPKPEEAAPAAKPAPKPAPKVAEAPRSAPARSGGYTSSLANPGNLFGGPALTLHPTKPSPPPQKQSSAAPPTRTAKAAPQPTAKPASESASGGPARRSVILFAKDATEPMESAQDQIRFLAGDLNAAMTRPSSRIELQAFGGARGDKGSDARRLSLKRALAIRQALIDDGVEPGRIDVRAMGGADTGPSDRVDVYVKA